MPDFTVEPHEGYTSIKTGTGSLTVFYRGPGFGIYGDDFGAWHTLVSADHARAIATALTEWADRQETNDE